MKEYYIPVSFDNKRKVYTFDGFKNYSELSYQNDNVTYSDIETFNMNHTYLSLYLSNKKFDSYVPEELSISWLRLLKKLEFLKKSLLSSKINIIDSNIISFFPKSFIDEYFWIKLNIIKSIDESCHKPQNYRMLAKTESLINSFSLKEINLSDGSKKKIKFSQKTKTGRLKTKEGSYPILTIAKSLRNNIIPANDLFVEFDYNGIDLRVFLFLNNEEQPNEDVHEVNSKLLNLERNQAKVKFFAWLYNLDSNNEILSKRYNRQSILDKFLVDGKIINPYNRCIETDNKHAINYLIQSTSTDCFFDTIYEINSYIKENNLQSYISFCLHDSMIIDFKIEEMKYLKEIKRIFENNSLLGKIKVNIKSGTDLSCQN